MHLKEVIEKQVELDVKLDAPKPALLSALILEELAKMGHTNVDFHYFVEEKEVRIRLEAASQIC
jgi:hypothetical protein